MRRRLAIVVGSVSTMVALAFVIPLGALVARTAEDRAMDRARSDAASVAPVLAAQLNPASLVVAVSATRSGAEGQMTVFLPDGSTVGADGTRTPRVMAALGRGTSSLGDADGGRELVTAVASAEGGMAAVRVLVPEADLRGGTFRAWVALAAVGIFLVSVAVAVADRLARSLVRPTERLAAAARRLGAGDLGSRVEPEGPRELAELGETFNQLGDRIAGMLEGERELIAELSHRLRTPLTRLRLDIEKVDDPALADRLVDDVEELRSTVTELIGEARRRSAGSSAPTCSAVEVARSRFEFWSVLAEEQSRPWELHATDDPARVPVSADDLAAALDVLIENVFAHTDEGVGAGVEVGVDDSEVIVSVRDQGSGLDPELAEAGRSGSGSSGLGLDIARRTAERSGGRFELGPGPGTEVIMVFPRRS